MQLLASLSFARALPLPGTRPSFQRQVTCYFLWGTSPESSCVSVPAARSHVSFIIVLTYVPT